MQVGLDKDYSKSLLIILLSIFILFQAKSELWQHTLTRDVS